MKKYGQLVHVEDYPLNGVHYRMAVFRIQGGLHAKWSCDACRIEEDELAPTHHTIEEAMAGTRKIIAAHHRQNHGNGISQNS